MKFLFAFLLALSLTACSSTPAASTSYDPATGVVSGLDSEDLADVVINKNYVTGATTQKAARPIFSMQGVEGQTMELKNVKSITVWAPETASSQPVLAAPTRRPNKFVAGLAAAGSFIRDIGSVATPIVMFTEQGKSARHQSDNNLEQYRINTNAWSGTTQAVVERGPYVYTVPAGSSAAPAATPAEPLAPAVPAVTP